MQRFRGNREIGVPFRYRFRNLRWRPLVHMQRNARVTLDEAFNHAWQCITRLSMGSGNIERAFIRPGVLAGDRLNGIDFGKHLTRNTNNLLTCGRHLSQMLTTAGENLDAKLIFQHPNLLADPRLGSIQPLSGRGDVKVMINHFNNVTKLLQFHNTSSRLAPSGHRLSADLIGLLIRFNNKKGVNYNHYIIYI